MRGGPRFREDCREFGGPPREAAPTTVNETALLDAVGAAAHGGPHWEYAAEPQPFWGGGIGIRWAGRMGAPSGRCPMGKGGANRAPERSRRAGSRGEAGSATTRPARTALEDSLPGIRLAGRPGVRPVRKLVRWGKRNHYWEIVAHDVGRRGRRPVRPLMKDFSKITKKSR